MQSAYSFYGSRLHLILEDELADAYNRAAKAFYDAQVKYREVNGIPWDPSTPLPMVTSNADQKAYADVGRVINLLVEINGGGLEIPEEECTSDYLVKL